jgi:hypothetical protein
MVGLVAFGVHRTGHTSREADLLFFPLGQDFSAGWNGFAEITGGNPADRRGDTTICEPH